MCFRVNLLINTLCSNNYFIKKYFTHFGPKYLIYCLVQFRNYIQSIKTIKSKFYCFFIM